jgi:hypothetical protein
MLLTRFKLFDRRNVLVLYNPVFRCQLDLIVGFPALGRMVSKKSSITTWNWGDTCPVVRFRTSAIFLECRDEMPTYTPTLDR